MDSGSEELLLSLRGEQYPGDHDSRRQMRHLVVGLVLMITWLAPPTHGSQPETKVATQCIKSSGLTFVSLYCGLGKLIRVVRKESYHGVHKSYHSSRCGSEDGDCKVNIDNLYDWTRCEKRNSCVQMIDKNTGSAECGDLKASYLQVTYICVDGEATSITPMSPVEDKANVASTKDTMTPLPVRTATPEMTIKAANICLNKTVHLSQLYIQSPGYSEFYPAGLDCRCEIRASEENSITVRFDEVKLSGKLGKKNRRNRGNSPLCDDWLMLEAPQYRGAGVVVCQDVDSRRRSLQSRSSHIILHLHTTPGLGVTSRRGFRILVTGSSRKEMAPPLEIDCYQTSAEVALASLPPGAAAADPSRPYALPPTNFGSASSQQSSANSLSSFPAVLILTTFCFMYSCTLGIL